MARRIADGQFTAKEVVEHFIHRLQALHDRCRVLTGERFTAAIDEADVADQRQSGGDWLGPLHGVPVTVKDCFDVAGLPTTLGIDGRSQPADQNAHLVRRLSAAGAIILGKTNVSQAMAYWESSNPRHGRTDHPTHPDRTPGGSSGGEAVAIAGSASALGLASDLGGSIRLPAHFCGVYALKPTSGILDLAGLHQAFPLGLPIATVAGPLARCVEDLRLAMSVLADSNRCWHNRGDARQPIRFAAWVDDGYFPTDPSVRRAVFDAADLLERSGAERIEFPLPDMSELFRIQLAVMFSDGGASLRQLTAHSRRHPVLNRMLWISWLPAPLRQLAIQFARFQDHAYDADILAAARPRSVADYYRVLERWQAWREDFARGWQAANIDVALFPVFPLPALLHGYAERAGGAACFTFLPNFVDQPAGVVPMTNVTAEDERRSQDLEVPRWVRDVMHQSAGLPIGIHVMGPRFGEDLVLRVMRMLETGRIV